MNIENPYLKGTAHNQMFDNEVRNRLSDSIEKLEAKAKIYESKKDDFLNSSDSKRTMNSVLFNAVTAIIKLKKSTKEVKSNKFLVEVRDIKQSTSESDFLLNDDYVRHFEVKKIERIDGVNTATIEVFVYGEVHLDVIKGRVSISSKNEKLDARNITIKALETTPRSLSDAEDILAQSEGWGLFYSGTEIEVQRIDELGVFCKDSDAHEFIKTCAKSGSKLHLKAKEILLVHNPNEHQLIFN